MTTKLHARSLAIAIATLLAVASPGAVIAAESAEATAARQEGQIWATYALSPFLRADDIEVAVVDGKATLTGIVDEAVNRELAGELALGIDGIRTVDNRIEVRSDAAPRAPGPRAAYGQRVDDATVTAAVRAKLAWSQGLDDARAEVSTRGGRVTLAGEVDSAADKALAQRLAAGTRGVASVDNQLRVAPAPAAARAPGGDDTVAQAVADSWITTKVKSTFMFSDNVHANDITVATASGTVTLSGKVSSGAERALAIELARNVRGVKTVVADDLVL